MLHSHRKKYFSHYMGANSKLRYQLIGVSDMIRGMLIYASGDTIASLILGEFMISRLLGMMIIGATIYALEIPHYFQWIDRKIPESGGMANTLKRTGLAIAYFNPLWIARHLLFIKIISLSWEEISWNLIELGFWSFLVNIPIAFIANYIIQNKIVLSWRFFSSAVFSALMAIYYALAELFFN